MQFKLLIVTQNIYVNVWTGQRFAVPVNTVVTEYANSSEADTAFEKTNKLSPTLVAIKLYE